MRSGSVIWSAALTLAGTVFLLDVLDVVVIDFWQVIGPLLLVLLGMWLLWGLLWGPRPSDVEKATIPLRGATRARVEIEHSVGRMVVGVHERSTDLLSGTFAGGLGREVRKEGDVLHAFLKPPDGGTLFPQPSVRSRGYHWNLGLHPGIPIALTVEEAGEETHIDLRALNVTAFTLHARAGAAEVIMPAHAGRTEAVVKSTAGAVSVLIPEGVACRIHAAGGLAMLLVDHQRFPRVSGDCYESPGYDAASQRVDLSIETVVGTITVR